MHFKLWVPWSQSDTHGKPRSSDVEEEQEEEHESLSFSRLQKKVGERGRSQLKDRFHSFLLNFFFFFTLQSNKKLQKSYREVSKTVPVHGYNRTLYSRSIILLLTTHGLMTKHVPTTLSYTTVKARDFALIHTYHVIPRDTWQAC